MFKILFLYLFLFFISCSSKNHEITYHNNGKVKYNVSYKNNKLDGVAITYDEDGNIRKQEQDHHTSKYAESAKIFKKVRDIVANNATYKEMRKQWRSHE